MPPDGGARQATTGVPTPFHVIREHKLGCKNIYSKNSKTGKGPILNLPDSGIEMSVSSDDVIHMEVAAFNRIHNFI